MSSSTTSRLGIIRKNPEVGFGVVGTLAFDVLAVQMIEDIAAGLAGQEGDGPASFSWILDEQSLAEGVAIGRKSVSDTCLTLLYTELTTGIRARSISHQINQFLADEIGGKQAKVKRQNHRQCQQRTGTEINEAERRLWMNRFRKRAQRLIQRTDDERQYPAGNDSGTQIRSPVMK